MARQLISSNRQVIESGDFSQPSPFFIQPIDNTRDLYDVHRLTYECMLQNVQGLVSRDGVWIPYPEFDQSRQTTIWGAKLGEAIVGSLSLTLDGKAGLPLDRHFDSTAQLARQSRRLAVMWRLVVPPPYSRRVDVAAALLTEAVRQGLKHGIETCLISVPGEFVPLFQEMLQAVALISYRVEPGFPQLSHVLMRAELENFIPDRD